MCRRVVPPACLSEAPGKNHHLVVIFAGGDGATGWYRGMVQCFGVGASWKVADATHIVLYKKKVTGVKSLDGRVACKLTTDNYGRGEWWLLLEPVES